MGPSSHPDYTQGCLDQGTDNGDGARETCLLLNLNVRLGGAEGCHRHDGGDADCEGDPKSCWAHSTGEGPWLTNEQEGAEETEGQGGRQKVAELAVIGSDNGGVVVPNEDGQGGREELGCADSQHCVEGLMVGQEAKDFGDALTLPYWATRPQGTSYKQFCLKGDRKIGPENRVGKLLETFPRSSNCVTPDGFSSRRGVFQFCQNGPSRLSDVLRFRAKDTDVRDPDSSCLSCIRL